VLQTDISLLQPFDTNNYWFIFSQICQSLISMKKSVTQFHTLTLKPKTIICDCLCFKIIYCENFSQTSGTRSPTDTHKPITNNPRWCQTSEVMWDVTESLLYIQQFERLFSVVYKFLQNAENVLEVSTYEMGLMMNWFF